MRTRIRVVVKSKSQLKLLNLFCVVKVCALVGWMVLEMKIRRQRKRTGVEETEGIWAMYYI